MSVNSKNIQNNALQKSNPVLTCSTTNGIFALFLPFSLKILLALTLVADRSRPNIKLLKNYCNLVCLIPKKLTFIFVVTLALFN